VPEDVPQNAFPDRRRVARFGVFELDLNAGELRKSGVKLRLQGQPFQVLALLLERAGDVVTREELQQKLWPSDTFVDFDHSLNTAINKVREALGDSASSPRYVETLARRGYRFIAPVQAPLPSARSKEVSSAAVNASREAPSGYSANRNARFADPAAAIHPELEVPIPRRAITRSLFALIQVMYLAFLSLGVFRATCRSCRDLFLRSPFGRRAQYSRRCRHDHRRHRHPAALYLMSAVGFDYQRLGEKFRQMFPFVLALDQLLGGRPIPVDSRRSAWALLSPSAPRCCICHSPNARSFAWRIWPRARAKLFAVAHFEFSGRQ
jgi:cholera toxin transcriptional activator